MVELRTGRYGQYYGSPWGYSEYLNESQKKTNATYIYSYFTAAGWTPNAIAGILGNLENESAINPGRWEGNNVGVGPGYGLVQWTPYTNYTVWCEQQGRKDPSEMDNNLDRIIWELENGLQYYATDDYPLNFREFTKSTKDPYYLACAFAWNYERSAVVLWGTEAEQEALRKLRGGSAEKWYTYITGETPTPPTEPDEPSRPVYKGSGKKMSFLLLALAGKRRR